MQPFKIDEPDVSTKLDIVKDLDCDIKMDKWSPAGAIPKCSALVQTSWID